MSEDGAAPASRAEAIEQYHQRHTLAHERTKENSFFVSLVDDEKKKKRLDELHKNRYNALPRHFKKVKEEEDEASSSADGVGQFMLTVPKEE